MIEEQLRAGLAALKLQLGEAQIQQLLAYLALLVKWNKTYNLTAIRVPEKMLTHHLLDSLAIVPFIQGETILDVGTGAGLPSVPLAICCPQQRITALDSNGKKTRFVQQVKRELALDNLHVEQARVETLQVEGGFDVITSRAFADLSLMLKLTKHLLAPAGKIAAMKGPRATQELAAIKPQITDLTRHTLHVPMLDGERHLLIFALK